MRHQERATPFLVLKVNEIYHDIEGQRYQEKHPEILEDEVKTWGALINFLQPGPTPFHLLDIGTGTGFVPLQIGKKLRPQDVLLCSDLSQGMLDVCRENLSVAGFSCRVEFLKSGGGRIPVADRCVDAVTINAVLHHMPDLGLALRELNRVLKPGGLVLMAHEPNAAFYRHFFLRLNTLILSPRLLMGAILRRAGLYELVRRCAGRIRKGVGQENEILEEVNRRLLGEGLIETPLSYERMYELLDVQAPDLGGGRGGRELIWGSCGKSFCPTTFWITTQRIITFVWKAEKKVGFGSTRDY